MTDKDEKNKFPTRKNSMTDLAKRFPENPILQPRDICPSLPGMKIEGLLNPGVFRFEGKT